jgi:hypothetical protein
MNKAFIEESIIILFTCIFCCYIASVVLNGVDIAYIGVMREECIKNVGSIYCMFRIIISILMCIASVSALCLIANLFSAIIFYYYSIMNKSHLWLLLLFVGLYFQYQYTILSID